MTPLEPLEGAWACRHLDSGLLAPRTGRDCISIILCPAHCDGLLQQSSDASRVQCPARCSGNRGMRALSPVDECVLENQCWDSRSANEGLWKASLCWALHGQ